jgi:S-disulfanyl-L-cysteine oxidoreductase SoxD
MFKWLSFSPSLAARGVGGVSDRMRSAAETASAYLRECALQERVGVRAVAREHQRGWPVGLLGVALTFRPLPRCWRAKPMRSARLGSFQSFVFRIASFAFAALCAASAIAQTPGRTATPAEIKAWDIDVRPDFKGLPAGSGSVKLGEEVWTAKCESCHGAFGESNEFFTPIVGHTTKADMKSGRVAKLASDIVPQRTTLMKLSQLSTLWDYINRAMPWNAPKSLTTDEVYAVSAYILHLGEIVPADFVLSDKNIREVQATLPNRDGKTREHGMWSITDKPDVQGSGCRANCDTKVEITSRLPDYARNAHGNLATQMRLIGGVRGADTTQPASATFASMLASATTPAPAPKPANAGVDPAKLAQQHACMACHGVTNKLVGPAMTDIHKKYRDAKDVVALLAGKIKAGGSGVWGAIPMPAQAHVPDADIRAMAEWIAKGDFK